MELALSTIEIWQLTAIRLFFYLFIFLGLFLYFKVKKPILFVGLVSLFSAITYLIIIYQSKLTWWGLQGDEIFVTAFLQKIAGGHFFSDFFYSGLPPFYPPLYFWLLGVIGYFFNLNGIRLAQMGVFVILAITPFVVYFWQSFYWKNTEINNRDYSWQALLAVALIFIVSDWSMVIFKPYEFISAVLVCFWMVFLLRDLNFKLLNNEKILFYGISGGLLFLTFYFWFFLVILAIALFNLFSKTEVKYYLRPLGLIFCLIGVLSLPFLLPLVSSYLIFGAENWQSAYFHISDLDFYLPFFEFSVFGLVSFIGLLTMIFYFRRPYIKALICLLISIYLWQLISSFTIIFFQTPFLPSKPFLFLGGAILSISAAYGLAEVIKKKIKHQKTRAVLFIVGWLILATQLLGGSFINKASTQNQLVEMKKPLREEYSNLLGRLKLVEGLDELTILSSGVSQLSAFLPLDYYVSYNIHFSHPAANFSRRYYFVRNLASSIDAKDFYEKLNQAPGSKIDALLLFKGPGFYPINFWLDNYPNGGRADEIRIPFDLINEQYFVKIFEDEYFVFYTVK